MDIRPLPPSGLSSDPPQMLPRTSRGLTPRDKMHLICLGRPSHQWSMIKLLAQKLPSNVGCRIFLSVLQRLVTWQFTSSSRTLGADSLLQWHFLLSVDTWLISGKMPPLLYLHNMRISSSSKVSGICRYQFHPLGRTSGLVASAFRFRWGNLYLIRSLWDTLCFLMSSVSDCDAYKISALWVIHW